MPVEKKARGKKKQKKKKNDPRKLEILDACFALGDACNAVSDWDDAIRYCERARAGYEEQQGRDSEKTLDVTNILIFARPCQGERIEKCRDLLKRCERALGEENVVTLKTLNKLGCELAEKEEHEEAREVHERCLAGRIKVLGEDHKDTCATLNNLGLVYDDGLKNHEKALECLERALKGQESTLGKNRPDTLNTVMNIAVVYGAQEDHGKTEELLERAFEGFEAQFGKDHEYSKRCVRKFVGLCLVSGDCEEMFDKLLNDYPRG